MPYNHLNIGYQDDLFSYQASLWDRSKLEGRVMLAMLELRNATADEVAEHMGELGRSTQPRLTDLLRKGLVYKTGYMGVSNMGCACNIWAVRVHDDPEVHELIFGARP